MVVIMYAEFEEKKYEQYMNYELADEFRLSPTGQHEESLIGIDAILFSSNPNFWGLWPIPFVPRGFLAKPELWDLDEDQLNSSNLPPFRCNVFIQYKRPEHIFGHNSKEYSIWKKPYYRFKIDCEQQEILCKLERNISSNSLVVYSCAAFMKSEELFDFYFRSELINNSNFVQPRYLRGHKSYTFENSGTHGVACSEPMHVENLDFFDAIKYKFDTANWFDSNVEFIGALNKSIMDVVGEFNNEYTSAFKSLSRNIEIPRDKLAWKFKNILIFTLITDTNWFIGL